jgi:hypothetical protein
MSICRAAVFAAVVAATPLAGQNPEEARLEVGDLVQVTRTDEVQVTGHVRQLGESWLTIAPETLTADLVRIEFSDMDGLARRERRGNSRLGAGIGGAVGILATIPIVASDDECPSNKSLDSCVTEAFLTRLFIPLLGGLVGAGVGAAIGAPFKSDQWVEIDEPFLAPALGFVPGTRSQWFAGIRIRP